uniref:Replication-associated protein ORF2/G2P domain-containing protein n=1 Tax=uncultured prokaryote TaxID=198431 RepID=A0A0H5Q257_9ZZZZ|nr:hypothetical protein [uncultured prokaryote]
MTLTVNPATQGFAGDHARKMIDSWKLLVKRIRRAFPAKRIEYLYVVEATKRGEPHMHVMMRAPFIPQKWLSKTWCELTEAFIVDIRRCNGAAEIANYCAKYAGKAPHHFQGCKRYMMSRAYILNKKPKETDGRWRNVDPLRVQIDGAWIVSVLKDEGWTFEQCSNGFIIAVGGTGPPPFLLSAR